MGKCSFRLLDRSLSRSAPIILYHRTRVCCPRFTRGLTPTGDWRLPAASAIITIAVLFWTRLSTNRHHDPSAGSDGSKLCGALFCPSDADVSLPHWTASTVRFEIDSLLALWILQPERERVAAGRSLCCVSILYKLPDAFTCSCDSIFLCFFLNRSAGLPLHFSVSSSVILRSRQ